MTFGLYGRDRCDLGADYSPPLRQMLIEPVDPAPRHVLRPHRVGGVVPADRPGDELTGTPLSRRAWYSLYDWVVGTVHPPAHRHAGTRNAEPDHARLDRRARGPAPITMRSPPIGFVAPPDTRCRRIPLPTLWHFPKRSSTHREAAPPGCATPERINPILLSDLIVT